ncbi:hypothetical protein EON68_00335 [archaeon]|nr:MAG: hypothetical protein EON68_00335 [archaeon]
MDDLGGAGWEGGVEEPPPPPPPPPAPAQEDARIAEGAHAGDDLEDIGADERARAGQQRPAAPRGARLYTVNGQRVAVTMHQSYQHRGDELRHLSLYMYIRLITCVPANAEPETADAAEGGGEEGTGAGAAAGAGAGRPRSRRYEFDEPHPLCETHVQRLRSKFPTLIMAGPRPPAYPGPRPARPTASWYRRAEAFAAFILVLFKP